MLTCFCQRWAEGRNSVMLRARSGSLTWTSTRTLNCCLLPKDEHAKQTDRFAMSAVVELESSGAGHGDHLPQVLRLGRAQAQRGGLCPPSGGGRPPGSGDSDLWNHDPGPPGDDRLAGGSRGDACGHGGHRSLLEAYLQPAGGPFYPAVGERPACEARPPDGRPTSRTASGWRNCSRRGCCSRVLSRPGPSASFGS